jgi:hypothetical protein
LAWRPMRLGTCLLYGGHTLQGARTKMAYFCSAPMEGFYAAVDSYISRNSSFRPQKVCRPLSSMVNLLEWKLPF